MCLTSDYCVFCIIRTCLYLTCHAGIRVIGAKVWYEIAYSPLSCAFGLIVFVYVAYSKSFSITNGFLKKFHGSFGIGLFVSSDT